PSKEVLETQARLLAQNKTEATAYVMIPESPLSLEESAELNQSLTKLQDEFDLGQRFVVVIANKGSAVKAINKVSGKMASGVRENIEGHRGIDLETNHLVWVFEDSVDVHVETDMTTAKILRSETFEDVKTAIARNTVAIRFAQLKGEAHQLNKELGDKVVEKEQIITSTLKGIANTIWNAIQAAFRVQTSA
ncbi:MAG: hypothetical protein HYZ85_00680, partial [Candidatus Omnitrophica bacterium]|nr:hypothetical protein [Candidatus Omnitrophota bacterium]